MITVQIPCHNFSTQVFVKPKQDRKCPLCKCWWRVDVSLLKEEAGKTFHKVEWTQIGRL
jgi:hypothetical protein